MGRQSARPSDRRQWLGSVYRGRHADIMLIIGGAVTAHDMKYEGQRYINGIEDERRQVKRSHLVYRHEIKSYYST